MNYSTRNNNAKQSKASDFSPATFRKSITFVKSVKQQEVRQVCFILKHQRQQLLSALVHIFTQDKIPRERKKVESKLLWITSCQQSFSSVTAGAGQSPSAAAQVSQLVLEAAEFHLLHTLSKTSALASRNREAMTTFSLAPLCLPNPNESMPVAFSPKKTGSLFICFKVIQITFRAVLFSGQTPFLPALLTSSPWGWGTRSREQRAAASACSLKPPFQQVLPGTDWTPLF